MRKKETLPVRAEGSLRSTVIFHLLVCGNPHRIKRAINEDQRHQEEGRADDGFQLLVFIVTAISAASRPKSVVNLMMDSSPPSCVLERIADGVADDGRGMKFGAFLFQIHFNDFLGVVPRAAGIGHEDGLEQAEERNAHEVTDEEIGMKNEIASAMQKTT